MATNWICNYAVVQATLPGVENLGYKFWIVWGVSNVFLSDTLPFAKCVQVICLAFVPITYLFYPEVRCTILSWPS
jgi:hypothetical protein